MNSNKGWYVTLAGTGINLALGVLYSWSVIAKVLSLPVNQGGWGWSAQQASLPYSVAVGVFAIMMVFAGRAQDKLGPRIVASLGGALTGIGMIISGFAHADSLWLMIVGFGVLAGSGIGLGYASATPAAVKWFHPSKKGLITGIVVSGFGLASIYIAPTTQALLDSFKVNNTFFILGGFFLVVTVLLSQMLVNPPADYCLPEVATTAVKKNAPVQGKREYDWHEMLKTPQFYLLWVMYALASFAGLMIIGHMAKIAAAQLPGTELGFLLVAVLAIGNAGGRIIAGYMSDRLGRKTTMLIVFLFQAAMMLILAQANTMLLLVIIATFIGFNYGANLTLFPSATTDWFGTKNFGVNYGLVFTAWGVGGVFGAQVAGRIVDATGSYNQAFLVAAGLLILAAGLTFLAKAPKEVAT